MDVDRSADGEGKETKETKDMHPPVKKYKMTEAMKGLIWNLVCLSNECCRIENEKKYVCRQFIWWCIPLMGLGLGIIFPARWKVRHHK
jgi:hypothetical protein